MCADTIEIREFEDSIQKKRRRVVKRKERGRKKKEEKKERKIIYRAYANEIRSFTTLVAISFTPKL